MRGDGMTLLTSGWVISPPRERASLIPSAAASRPRGADIEARKAAGARGKSSVAADPRPSSDASPIPWCWLWWICWGGGAEGTTGLWPRDLAPLRSCIGAAPGCPPLPRPCCCCCCCCPERTHTRPVSPPALRAACLAAAGG
ncbi:unnamed protein product, partial [Ectocarpus sp. 12 AP-2014]